MGGLPEKNGAAGAGRFVFGPAPSRRLGLSLGLDLVPAKTCTLDCLYCELGRTTTRTVERFDCGQAEAVLQELEAYLAGPGPRPAYITLGGSGEPTLNAEIGRIIEGAGLLSRVPVAVLTNGTLLDRAEVRRDLARADLVLPSLDTARPETFARLNRPEASLDLGRIIEGLAAFRAGFGGEVWLEILLVKGYNDGPEELEALKAAAARIRPDRIQLNTVFRPPAEAAARALSPEELARAARVLGPGAEVVAEFSSGGGAREWGDLRARILSLVGRRPCTEEDLARALVLPRERVREVVSELEVEGAIRREGHEEQDFFRGVVKRGSS